MGIRFAWCLGIVLAVIVGAAPTRAHDTQISGSTEVTLLPVRPQPGSTVQVIANTQATVRFEQRAYPSFELPGGGWRVLLPLSALLKAGDYPLQIEKDGIIETRQLPVASRSFGLQRLRLSPERAGLEATPTEEAAISTALSTVSPEQLWRMPFAQPTRGRVSSKYGLRRTYNGVVAKDYYHRGLDYATPRGTAVFAPTAGRVALVGTVQQGFKLHGNTLVLDHGQGVTSIYIHLQKILVRVGDMVKLGEKVALVGSTGRASGPHLHWGLYVHRVAVDPAGWLQGQICCKN